MSNLVKLSQQKKTRLRRSVNLFSQCRILVIGDLMLDTFIWGDVKRISPEAPVPVVEVREESQLLGGSANVAHNVASLGGQAIVTGVLGKDHAGRQMLKLFKQLKVVTDGLIFEQGRPTTTKTRVIARNQQVVRYDREWKTPLREESAAQILDFLRDHLPAVNAVIVSDYSKGVITRSFLDQLRTMVAGVTVPVIVDPKVQNADYYRSFTMVTPNHHEAERMSGIEIVDETSLIAAGRRLLEQLECQTVLITRGRNGMSLFHHDGTIQHIPTVARRVFDVTGAGDTVIATLALGIGTGLSVEEAAVLANLAAGAVVGEVGTAAVTAQQLLNLVANF
jgi:D-glycero-beta-D-manno-heptose-7-phosphate kinase